MAPESTGMTGIWQESVGHEQELLVAQEEAGLLLGPF
jgi:hypothetical protein